jgi:PAS domain S-box-containing protein
VATRSTGQAHQPPNRAAGVVHAGRPDSSYAHVFWTAFRNSANAMFVAGLDRRIVAVNEAGAVLAGRSAEALEGERMTTLLDDPAEAPDDAVWRAQVLRGESFGRRRIRRPDGSVHVVDFAMQASRAAGTVLVLGVCVRDHGGRRSERTHEPAPLTKREQEIVRLIALGDVTPEICAALHIAPDTVRTHVRNAMAKTGARTRAQLIAIALTEGLIDD